MAYITFREFDQDLDIAAVRGIDVTTGMWSGDTGSLNQAFTSSQQFQNSGEFYYDVYNGTDLTTSEVQFSVAYGHISGGGSPTLANLNTSTLPTQVTYGQYRNILLDKNTNQFTFGTTGSDDIYVINVQRSRYRQTIDPGNWQLGLSGSKGLFTFIDDSGLGTTQTGNIIANNVYNIVSGTINSGQAADTTVYGRVFPDYGLLVLHPNPIRLNVGFSVAALNSRDSSTAQTPYAPYTGYAATKYQYQHEGLFRSIKGAMALTNGAFIARTAENITSRNYFVRLRNSEFNYSNNPTYYTGSNPQRPLEAFRTKPVTYVTTIGLYTDQNELLAVAKLSRPIQKSIDREALIRVRLDY